MSLFCTGCGMTYWLVALAVVVLTRWLLLSPSARRAPTRPAVPAERKTPRGNGAEMKCVSPSTGADIGSIRAYTPADVKDAEQAARRAAEGKNGWMATDFAERRAVLQDLLDWVVTHQEELIAMSIRDSGKTGEKTGRGTGKELMTVSTHSAHAAHWWPALSIPLSLPFSSC